MAIDSDNLCSICNEEVSSNVEKHIIQKHIRQIKTVQTGTEKSYNMYKCPVCKKYFKKEDLNHSHDKSSKNLSKNYSPDEKDEKNNDEESEVNKQQQTGTGSDYEQRPTKDMETNAVEPAAAEVVIKQECLDMSENNTTTLIEKNSEIIIIDTSNRKRKSELMEKDGPPTRPEKIVKPSGIHVNFHSEKSNNSSSSSIKILSPFDNNEKKKKSSSGIMLNKEQCTFHGCKLTFKSPDNLKLHLKNFHGIHLYECVSSKSNPNICKWGGCNTEFYCHESLKSHIKIIHPNLWNYLEKNMNYLDITTKRHDCQWTECNLSFVSKKLLKRHIKIMHLKLWWNPLMNNDQNDANILEKQNYLENNMTCVTKNVTDATENEDDEPTMDFQIENIQTLTEEQFKCNDDIANTQSNKTNSAQKTKNNETLVTSSVSAPLQRPPQTMFEKSRTIGSMTVSIPIPPLSTTLPVQIHNDIINFQNDKNIIKTMIVVPKTIMKVSKNNKNNVTISCQYPGCDQFFVAQEYLDQHIKSKHIDKPKHYQPKSVHNSYIWSCHWPDCNQISHEKPFYSSKRLLIKHINKCHMGPQQKADEPVFSKNLLCKWPGCNFSTDSLMMLHEHSLDPYIHHHVTNNVTDHVTNVTDESVTRVTSTTDHDNFDQNIVITNENVDPLALDDQMTDDDPLSTCFESDIEINLKVHEGGQKNNQKNEDNNAPKSDEKVEDFETCFIKMENPDSIEPDPSDDDEDKNEFSNEHFIKNVTDLTKNVTGVTKNVTDVTIFNNQGKSLSLSCKWPSCDFSSKSLQLLQKHYEQNHHQISEFQNSVITTKIGSNNPMFQNLSVRKTIFCKECKRYTENTNHTCQKYAAAGIHIKYMKDYKCSICKKRGFVSQKQLLRHICLLHQPTVKLEKSEHFGIYH